MKTLTYDSREEWKAGRKGKATGSKLKDLVVKLGTGKKIGYYQLIAERLAVEEEGNETPMDRGTRLESEAIQRLSDELEMNIDTSLVIWTRDDDESIAISPDGIISNQVAVEAKCLSSARHLEAYLTQSVPDEYHYQVMQYFIVNDELQTLLFCFYDPRIASKDFFYLELHREKFEEEIAELLEYERQLLAEVRQIATDLSF